MKISDDVIYIGVNDHNIDLFEGQFKVPSGMAYNSYAIVDEKIAIMDTVDKHFTAEWLNNLKNALEGKTPDYLIVQHMEMDHAGSIASFMEEYPEAKIVSSAMAFNMMKNFFGTDFENRKVVVGENSTLPLGQHTLTFVTAAMVHWPEVIMTYDNKDKILFSADGFGKFGALDVNEDWVDEARRYYFGIVGKFGPQVQAVLKKAYALDIKTICPLHGPVLNENLNYYINLYNTWSSYVPEENGVVVTYTSVYGNNKKAVEFLSEKLKENGCKNVKIFDLARCDMSEAISDAFRFDKLVIATTTYNSDIFPFAKEFINGLTERSFQNRRVALIENGSWAPLANKVMMNMLSSCKNITFAENNVTIMSSLQETSKNKIESLAEEFAK